MPVIEIFGAAGFGVLCFRVAESGVRQAHIHGCFWNMLIGIHRFQTASDRSATIWGISQSNDMQAGEESVHVIDGISQADMTAE